MRTCCRPIRSARHCWRRNDNEKDDYPDDCLHVPRRRRECTTGQRPPSLGAGLLYKNGLDVTLAYEHEMNYRHAWEFFANGYLQWAECESCKHVCPKSFWQNYRTYGFGVAYKPCVTRDATITEASVSGLRAEAIRGSSLSGCISATSTTMCCGRAGRYTGKSRRRDDKGGRCAAYRSCPRY